MVKGDVDRLAAGDPSDSNEGFVIRSGVRSGLKREFAFALKVQAEIQSPLGRTRSGKAPARPAATPALPRAKRSRKSDTVADDVVVIDVVEARNADSPSSSQPLIDEVACHIPKQKLDDSVIYRLDSDLEQPLTASGGLLEASVRAPSISPCLPPVDEEARALEEGCSDNSSFSQTGSDQFEEPLHVGTTSEITAAVVDVSTASPVPLGSAIQTSVVADVLDDFEAPTCSGEGSVVTETSINVQSPVDCACNSSIKDSESGVGVEVKVFMRFTRSAKKDSTDVTISPTYGRHAAVQTVDSRSLSVTPKKNMELKMSKKISMTKLPSNPRELLASGLMEGLSVKYTTIRCKKDGLRGEIKGGGIICFCETCKGERIVTAYQFETHAGSLKKYPWDYICLENGRSLRNVFEACAATPLDLLETTIQNVSGQVVVKKIYTCLKCKESLDFSLARRSELLCDSCLETKQLHSMQSTPHDTDNSVRSCGSILTSAAPDNVSLPKNASSGGKHAHGKMTKKDSGLHKLVFATDILPKGTEVGYYIRGQRLLEGFIEESGILCGCCSTVVSPSQFEAHAGQSKRRKPYNHIYTTNGVSLHELSVSLSKERKLSANENDDLCGICSDGGDLLCCDICPRAFHKECLGLSTIPEGDWYCQFCKNMLQREKCVQYNENAYAAGRIPGVNPIEQIYERCTRVVNVEENDVGGCVFCRRHDFSKFGFNPRTVLLCDQCEREYHVGCLRDHKMVDLKELPEGEWFCHDDCRKINAALQDLLLRGPISVPVSNLDIITRKYQEKGLSVGDGLDIRWRLLRGKSSTADCKFLLSKALSIFQECFDPIVDVGTNRDLIPYMVYGRSTRDQDFGGMYCAVLNLGSSVVSAGILRILGCEVAELPLVATTRESQGLGYFQLLFTCIERLLASLNIKHFILPAAEEAESIWTQKFGFSRITTEQLHCHAKAARTMFFQGTSMLHKLVPGTNLNISGTSS